MDYMRKLDSVRTLLEQEHYAQAVQTAAGILEHLLKDLYSRLLSRSPSARRRELTDALSKIGRGKSLDELTLGQVVGVYRHGGALKDVRKTLGLELSPLDIGVLGWLVDARNRVAHKDHEPHRAEAAWVVNLVEMVLRQTSSMLASDLPETEDRAEVPRVPDATINWSAYCDGLAKQLETARNRVWNLGSAQPLGLISRRVRGGKLIDPSAGDRPWQDAAIDDQGRLAVLLSGPGEGKSVCMHQLAVQMLEDYRQPSEGTVSAEADSLPRPLPVPVQLIGYDPQLRPLAELLAETFQLCGLRQVTADCVKQIFSGDQPLVMLADGLDEASNKRTLINELNSFSRKAAGSHSIVSCREESFQSLHEQLTADVIWRLVRLEREEVESFLERHLENESDRARFQDWLEDPKIAEVLETPFFLSTFFYLQSGTSRKPASRFELCQAFVDELHEREFKHLGEVNGAPRGTWQAVLDAVAEEMHRAQVSQLATSHFDAVAGKAWGSLFYGDETSSRKDQILGVLHRLPLITGRAGQVSFVHSLFQDFFAARWLKSRMELLRPLEFQHFVDSSQWQYPIVLLSGSVPDGNEVIDSLIYCNAESHLMSRCLLEARGIRPTVLENALKAVCADPDHPDHVLNLRPLLAHLPETHRESWAVIMGDAYLRAHLWMDLAGLLAHRTLWDDWAELVAHADGLSITREMVRDVVQVGMQSTFDRERIGAILLGAAGGHWALITPASADENFLARWFFVTVVFRTEEGKEENALLITEAVNSLIADVNESFGEWDEIFKDKDGARGALRELAIRALGRIKHPLATEALLHWMRGDELEVSRWAAIALGRKGDGRAVPRLLGIFFGEDIEHESVPFSEMGDVVLALQGIETSGSNDALFFMWAWRADQGWWAANVLRSRDDPRAMIIDWAEEIMQHEEELRLYGYLTFDPWEGLWQILSKARADPELRESFVGGLLIAEVWPDSYDHSYLWNDKAARALSEMIEWDPGVLARIALSVRGETQYVSSHFAWARIGTLLSAYFELAEALLGKASCLSQHDLRENLRKAIPTELAEAWEYIGIGQPVFKDPSDGKSS